MLTLLAAAIYLRCTCFLRPFPPPPKPRPEVEGRHGSPPSPSPRSSSAPSQPQPIVHTVGRTYLVPTIRIPPFPPSSEGVEEEGERGVVDDATLVIREERRVFEWMTGMLQLGNGALGATVATPVAGSPVVLDLGAVSQASDFTILHSMVCVLGLFLTWLDTSYVSAGYTYSLSVSASYYFFSVLLTLVVILRLAQSVPLRPPLYCSIVAYALGGM